MSADETPIEKVKNVGPKTAVWLHDIGIHTAADLHALGAVEVYKRLRASRPDVTLNALWALQAAMMDISYTQLPLEIKDELLTQLKDESEK